MKGLARCVGEERQGESVLMDVVSAVMDIAQNDREVTAVVLQMLRSGSIRLRGPLDEAR